MGYMYVTRCPGAWHRLCCMIGINVCLLGIRAGRYWNFAEDIILWIWPLGRKTNMFTLSGLNEEDLPLMLLVNKTACTNCLYLVAYNHIPYMETPTIQPTHDHYLRYYTFNTPVWTATGAVTRWYRNRYRLWAKYQYTAQAYLTCGLSLDSWHVDWAWAMS